MNHDVCMISAAQYTRQWLVASGWLDEGSFPLPQFSIDRSVVFGLRLDSELFEGNATNDCCDSEVTSCRLWD